MDNIREQVRWFSEQMESILRANDDKGGWEGCSADYLLSRMQEELEEMIEKASEIGWDVFMCVRADKEKIDDLIRECADIANFAMMIADNARNRAVNDE